MYVLLTFLLVPAHFNGIYIQSLGLNKFTCLAGINRIIPRVFSAAPRVTHPAYVVTLFPPIHNTRRSSLDECLPRWSTLDSDSWVDGFSSVYGY